MTLRRGVLLYVVIIHIILATCGAYLLQGNRLWLFLVEGVFAASLIASIILYRRIFRLPNISTVGADFLKEQDFQSRFRTVGQPEVDQLINLYNSIAENLQQEKIKLQEQEYFLGKLLDATPAGIITFDLDRHIDRVNPAAKRILAAKDDHPKGKMLSEFSPRLSEGTANIEMGGSTVLSLDGRKKIKCWKSQFLDRGFPREFLMFEELTEELRRMEKISYENLIRLMSHEVNNSIGAANSLLHSSLHYKDQIRPIDRSDFESAIQIAITRTEHLSSFMKVFADLVRLPPPQFQSYDIVKLLRDTVRLFEPELLRRNIKLTWRIEAFSLMIPIDLSQMEQVLINILKNSVDAVDKEGEITIVIADHEGKKVLQIEDSGPGISPEVKAKLFTPFYTSKPSGQGIGLTLASEVLQRHGFAYSLDSESGRTRFIIEFN